MDSSQMTSSQAPATDLTRRATEQHFEALDGLRGIAILLVLAEHYGQILAKTGWERWAAAGCANGRLGVDLFFVLSGFLITRILVGTRENPGYFRIFYARRAIRIFPLYYAFLLFIYAVLYPALAYRWHTQIYQPNSALYYLCYFANFRHYDAGADLGLVQMWSLSVEEQFYLVWPLLVYLTPRRRLLALCGGGIALAIATRSGMLWLGMDRDLIVKFTINRLDSLLLGAAIGIVQLDDGLRGRAIRWVRPAFLAALAAMVAMLATGGFDRERDLTLTLGLSIAAVFFGAVVFWAATVGAGSPLLRFGALRSLGRYSYAIYVIHLVPMLFTAQLCGSSTTGRRVAQIAVNFLASLILARLSWVLLEAPCLRLKRHFRYGTAPAVEPAVAPPGSWSPMVRAS